MTQETPQRYSAALVTFRRPDSLATVLEALRGQTVTPSLTVVVDNDRGESGRGPVETAKQDWPGRLLYVPAGANLGPAGGWALAVEEAGKRFSDRGDWVLILDDDDPLTSPELVGRLLSQPELLAHGVGGIGLRGARLDARAARLRRVEPVEPNADRVDYLAGNGAPLYSWRAIDQVGFFRSELFFGFEDLEWGLRLKTAGFTLLVAPKPSLHTVPDTATVRVPWREYYKTRALIWILARHVGAWPTFVAALRSISGGLRIAWVHRSFGLLTARIRGTSDALRQQMGVRRYLPVTNPAKATLTPPLDAAGGDG